FLLLVRPPLTSTLFPYTPLFRSQVGNAGTEFAHANLLIFLDSNLRIAKWIYGTDYSGRDVDLALKVAAGESDWIGEHSQLLYARSEEHTSELQSPYDLVCRLLLE